MLRTGIPLLVAVLACAAGLHAQTPPPGSFSGAWMGQLDLAGETIVFKLSDGAVDFVPAGPQRVPLQGLSIEAMSLRFALPLGGSTLHFEGTLQGDEAAGTVKRDAAAGRFRMIRLATVGADRRAALAGSYETASGRVVWLGPFGELGAELYVLDFASHRFAALYPRSQTTFVAGPAILVPLFPLALTITLQTDAQGQITGLLYQEGDQTPVPARRRPLAREEVTFRNGPLRLAGLLTVPPAPKPIPAVVLLHGSGPEDRLFLGPWIDFFARQGLAVLSYDKRGVGGSAGDWKSADFAALAGDAAAAVRFLRGRSEVDPHRIGLFGVSQGGWIAPLVAAEDPRVAFLIIHSGAAVTPARQGEMHLEQELRAYGFGDAEIAKALHYARLDAELTRTGKGWDELVAADRQARAEHAEWLVSELQPADSWFRTFFRRIMDFDPAPSWRRVKCPVLALFGERDLQVPARPNRDLLEAILSAAQHRDHTLEILPQANHLFLQAETGVMTEYPRLRAFVPGYFERLGTWLQRTVPARPR